MGAYQLLQPEADLVAILASEIALGELAMKARRAIIDELRRLGAWETVVWIGRDEPTDELHEMVIAGDLTWQ